MFGKGSLLAVFGFITAFSIYQLKLNNAITAVSDNFNEYYVQTVVHQEVINAMNFGVNKVWATETNSDSFQIVANSCTTNVSIYPGGLDTVIVKARSWDYYFDQEYYAQYNKSAKYADSAFAYFSFTMPISKYFMFTNTGGNIFWITGDTVWGPIHSNHTIKTSGSPVFYGKVTAYKGISPDPTKKTSQAYYYGGWEIGNKVDMPKDMSLIKNTATASNAGAPMNTKCLYDQETTFDFQANGDVIRTVGANPPDTVAITSIAPAGVVYCTKDIRVKGVFNGRVTFYSDDDIWIDDNITYANDPETDPYSDDIIGLVANDDVIITDNVANNVDINIQACIMAVNGSFTADNYSGRPPAGVLKMTGSVVQDTRGAVGTFNWVGLQSGFRKSYRFDDRLERIGPPCYPLVRTLTLLHWWET